jgi:hypothetical protein
MLLFGPRRLLLVFISLLLIINCLHVTFKFTIMDCKTWNNFYDSFLTSNIYMDETLQRAQ